MIASWLRGRWAGRSWREKRLFLYLLLVLGLAGWKFMPRYWKPVLVIETEHYRIETTAERSQAEEVGRVLEILYSAYTKRFESLARQELDGKFKVRLYKDREEFRRINPGTGWAEAFYRKPYCHGYYSANETNPYHWMAHEAVHQLNEELMGFELSRWLEEGLAEYFAVSRIRNGRLELGTIDTDAYPVWWVEEIAREEKPSLNVANGSIIPLKAVIRGRGGPRINSHVNLYYLHWWTLTHFLFERANERDSVLELLKGGGDVAVVEKHFGPVGKWEEEWHAHVRRIREAVDGTDLDFLRTGRLAEVDVARE